MFTREFDSWASKLRVEGDPKAASAVQGPYHKWSDGYAAARALAIAAVDAVAATAWTQNDQHRCEGLSWHQMDIALGDRRLASMVSKQGCLSFLFRGPMHPGEL